MRYGSALLGVGAALLARLTLTNLVGPNLPTFITFYPAVMGVALLAGFGPGLLATGAAALVADYWAIPPFGSFRIANTSDVVALTFFILMGGLMSAVAGRFRRVQEELRRHRDQLQDLVAARTRELEQSNTELTHQIDEHRRVAGNLTKSESLLRLVMDLVPLAIFAKDRQGRHLFINRAGAEFNGLTPDQLIGRKDLDFVHVPAEAAAFMRDDEEVIATAKRKFVPEETLTDAAGQAHILQTTKIPFIDPATGEPAILGVSVDITERKRMEEAHWHLAAIVESSEDAILSKTLDGVILTWNAGAERIFGYTAQEAAGQPITLIIPPAGQPGEIEVLERLRRGEIIKHYETQRVTKDGRVLDVALTISPVKDHEERVIAASTIIRDISELVAARRVLTRSKEDLERMVADRTAKMQELIGELEHFSYAIIHDMRAPLRAIQGFAEMVDQGCREPEAKELLQHIRNAASRMDLLIRDALNYDQAVQHELPLTSVDASALLREMLNSYPEYQSARSAIEIKGEIPKVRANEAGLTQCFSNLLNNALKFAKPGQPPQIRVWSQTQEEWVRICVEDRGIGIPKTMQSKVFNIFSRGHQDYPGTGIGLALVRKIMERMGGQVTVESEEGQGSRFWLQLTSGVPGNPTDGGQREGANPVK